VPLLEKIEGTVGTRNHQKLSPTVDIGSEGESEVLEEQKDRRIRNAGESKKRNQKAQNPRKPGPLPRELGRVEQMERKATDPGWGAGVCDTKIHGWNRYSDKSNRARGFRQFFSYADWRKYGSGPLICMIHNILEVFTRSSAVDSAAISGISSRSGSRKRFGIQKLFTGPAPTPYKVSANHNESKNARPGVIKCEISDTLLVLLCY